MSYSFSVPAGPKADLDNAVLAAGASTLDVIGDQFRDAAAEHLAAIADAAVVIASHLGRPDDHVGISVSGHANPDHAPLEGWADECVTLSFHIVKVD